MVVGSGLVRVVEKWAWWEELWGSSLGAGGGFLGGLLNAWESGLPGGPTVGELRSRVLLSLVVTGFNANGVRGGIF